jgi:hypothetical protein
MVVIRQVGSTMSKLFGLTAVDWAYRCKYRTDLDRSGRKRPRARGASRGGLRSALNEPLVVTIQSHFSRAESFHLSKIDFARSSASFRIR